MTDAPSSSLRALVLHPEDRVRDRLGELLRSRGAHPVMSAATPAEGLRIAAWFHPRLVLVDLGHDRASALEAIRDLRKQDRLLVGIHNPLLVEQRGDEVLRAAVRAGIGEFVALPPSEEELALVLERLEEQAEPDDEGKILTFFGAKGGVGTTTLATSVALMMAGSGQAGEVALCDADLQFGDVATLLGLSPGSDLADLVREVESPGAVSPFLTVHESTGLHVLPRPATLEAAESVDPSALTRALLLLRRRFDRVVVDTSSSLDLLTLATFDLAEKVFVVTEAVAPSILATSRLLRALERLGLPAERVRIIVNRHVASEENLAPGTIAEHLGRPVDHLLAEDRNLIAAAHRGKPAILGRSRSELARVVGAIGDDAVRPVHTRITGS